MKSCASFPNSLSVFLAIVISATMLGAILLSTAPSANAQSLLGSPPANAVGVMSRFGHDAIAMTAAGGVLGDAAAAITEVAGMDTELASLADLRSSRDASAEDVAEIREAIWRGGGSPARLTVLQNAEVELATKQAAVDQAENALRTDVEEFLENRLGASGMAVIARFHANRDCRVPNHFKALDLSDSEWQLLEAACVKSSRGLTLIGAESSILSQCQSDPLAILVASRLATNLASIEVVFDAALAPEE